MGIATKLLPVNNKMIEKAKTIFLKLESGHQGNEGYGLDVSSDHNNVVISADNNTGKIG